MMSSDSFKQISTVIKFGNKQTRTEAGDKRVDILQKLFNTDENVTVGEQLGPEAAALLHNTWPSRRA